MSGLAMHLEKNNIGTLSHSININKFHLYILINLLFYLFIFGCVGSSVLCVGFLQLRRAGISLRCGAWASCGGFFCCGARVLGAWASVVVACGLRQLWLVGSRAQTQQLWCTGLVAPWHVGFSRTRARTCVPCIGRWILNHCATREAPDVLTSEVLKIFFNQNRNSETIKYTHIKKIKILYGNK